MKNRTLIFILIAVAVLALSIGRFGGNSGNAPASLNRSHFNSESAPDFTLERLNGSTITLSDYKDKKAVVLDFWASWCPNCKRDMPKLNKFYEKYNSQVEVIGIYLQERKNIAKDYISSANINFPIVLDPTGQISSSYGVRYTNYHVLIDIDGNLTGVVPGDIRESDITNLIKQN